MNNIQNSFNLPKVSLESLLWNLLTCTILSLVICCHFNMRSKKRFLRRDLGLVLPVICLTTLLVISVVKSSLALSLGLVGALSIVRFRTPIKEPEELVILEIKVDNYNETMLKKVLEDLTFSPKRFSKYCESIIPSNHN